MKNLESLKKALMRDTVFTTIFGIGIILIPALFFLFWGTGTVFTIGTWSSIGATLILATFLRPSVGRPGIWTAIAVALATGVLILDGIVLSTVELFILIGGSMVYFVVLLLSRGRSHNFFRIKRKKDIWNDGEGAAYNELSLAQIILPILSWIIFLGNDWWWIAVPLAAALFMLRVSNADGISKATSIITVATIAGLLLAWPAIKFVGWLYGVGVIQWIWDVRIWIGLILGIIVIASVTRAIFLKLKIRDRRIAQERADAEAEEKLAADEAARLAEIQRISALETLSDEEIASFLKIRRNNEFLSRDAVFPEAEGVEPTRYAFSALVKLCETAHPTERAMLAMRYLGNNGLHLWQYNVSEEHRQVFFTDTDVTLVDNAIIIATLLSSQNDEHIWEGKRLMTDALPEEDQRKIRNRYREMMETIFSTVEKNCHDRGKKIFAKIKNPYAGQK